MSNNSSESMADLWGVISESKRIINAHSRHFLALSILFLLPLSFSLIVFPTLFHTFTSSHHSNHIISLLRLNSHSKPFLLHHPHHKIVTFSLLFTSFTLFLSLCALSSIIYSVFHGFYGRPVKFFSSIKSVFYCFLPLLVTFMIAQIVVFLIFGLFWLFGYLGVKVFRLILGEIEIEMYFSSYYFVGVLLLGMVLVYVCIRWYLVGVVVVIESKWGFEPMIRSKNLMRGMGWVGLSLIMFFGLFVSVLVWVSMVSSSGDSGFMRDGWGSWLFGLRIVVMCAVLTLVLLHSIAASTVLYIYCKALHGELAGEIANEFGAEYVSLPFDEKKVPHVVYFVQ